MRVADPAPGPTTVAWLGLGAMGARMAGRVAEAGYHLTVWNRTPGRAEPLVAAGARVAGTPADAVRRAEVVFLMLADPDAVREVNDGPTGMAAGIDPDAVVVDLSTVGPAAGSRLRAALPTGAALLDAPVLGSLAEADAGTLTLLVGGSTEATDRVRPVLSVLGEPVQLGPAGTGAAAKLVANAALLATVAALGEVVAIADRLDLPRAATWQVLAHTPLAGQAERRRPGIESGDYPPRFALGLARKDADLVLAAAGAADADGAELRLTGATRDWLADAEAAGLGESDYTAVLGHILSADVIALVAGGTSPRRS